MTGHGMTLRWPAHVSLRCYPPRFRDRLPPPALGMCDPGLTSPSSLLSFPTHKMVPSFLLSFLLTLLTGCLMASNAAPAQWPATSYQAFDRWLHEGEGVILPGEVRAVL